MVCEYKDCEKVAATGEAHVVGYFLCDEHCEQGIEDWQHEGKQWVGSEAA